MSNTERDIEKGYSNTEFAAKLRRLADCVEAGQRAGSVRKVDPNHFVAILAGATMWYATNSPLLEDPSERDSHAEQSQARFRSELLGVTRHLLGDPNAGESS